MNELSVIERRELKELEAIVEAGMATFYEVGRALMLIRDGKFYRESHKTFELYCSERWGMSRPRAYQLIEACEVRQDLSTIVDKNVVDAISNEGQIRELAKVDLDSLPAVAEVLKERIDEGEPVTAKVIRKVIEDLKSIDETPEPVAKKQTPADTAITNAVVCDGLRTAINAALRLLSEVEEVPGTEMLVNRERSIRAKLESAKDEVVAATPDRACPKCKGKACVACGNLGWLTARMQ